MLAQGGNYGVEGWRSTLAVWFVYINSQARLCFRRTTPPTECTSFRAHLFGAEKNTFSGREILESVDDNSWLTTLKCSVPMERCSEAGCCAKQQKTPAINFKLSNRLRFTSVLLCAHPHNMAPHAAWLVGAGRLRGSSQTAPMYASTWETCYVNDKMTCGAGVHLARGVLKFQYRYEKWQEINLHFRNLKSKRENIMNTKTRDVSASFTKGVVTLLLVLFFRQSHLLVQEESESSRIIWL
jgi:hypothetical protein